MITRFQIQEIVHQDSEGVIFQALDQETGHLVALRRFFLSDRVLARLREKEENGKTVFENGTEWLKTREIPHLQKVVAGGFDDVDDTPYLVTEWAEGQKLTEAHQQGTVLAGEGRVFDSQARSVLLALPMEIRPAVCLQEEKILVSRDQAGALQTKFSLSPRIFYGSKGGEEVASPDRQSILETLAGRFPEAIASEATPIKGQVKPAAGQTAASTQPVLKSANPSAGGGLLWGALISFVVILGVMAWLVFQQMGSNSDDAGQLVEQVEEPNNLEKEEKASEEVAVAEPTVANPVSKVSAEEGEAAVTLATNGNQNEPTLEPVETLETTADAEVAPIDATEDDAREENPIAMVPMKEDSIEEGQVVEEEAPEPKVVMNDGPFSPDDLEEFRKRDGQTIMLEGEVVECPVSKTGNAWYLDFGDKHSQVMVTLYNAKTQTEFTKEDWESFEGKEVIVTGTAKIAKGPKPRGSGVNLLVKKKEDVKLKLEPEPAPEEPKEKVYQYSDLDDLRVVSLGAEIIFEGVYARYQKHNGFVYLFFEDDVSSVGRFEVGGPLSNRAIANQLEALKGQRVRLLGSLESDDNPKFQVVIHLSAQDALGEALPPEEQSLVSTE